MSALLRSFLAGLACSSVAFTCADDLPPIRPVHEREAEYYQLTDVPISQSINLEASSFERLPDGRLAIGTRRGEIYFVSGALGQGEVKYQLFASGLHEVFGLAWNAEKKALYATQQCEVTRITDLDGDDRADRFETICDTWGFGGEHEFTYGSKFDRDGNLWTVHCLTGSYTSESLFRGWCLRTTPEGKTIPTCSGLRSPGGIGMNAAGDMFYVENQGPWNGACSLKHLRPGGFMGHPISFPWYKAAPNMGPVPAEPKGGREQRQHLEAARIPQLVPPSVVFPYKRMGQSASAITLDESEGNFGPFNGQLFVADYTLSLLMRADTELVNGVYQGACFPFREGFSTGLIGAILTREGQYLAGGCSRGWPARGPQPYALQRLEWTGKTPFEFQTIRIRRNGFSVRFTQPVDPKATRKLTSWKVGTFTHFYSPGYGSPEVDHQDLKVTGVSVAEDGLSAEVRIADLRKGYIHEITAAGVRSNDGEPLLHETAWYTVNQIPQ